MDYYLPLSAFTSPANMNAADVQSQRGLTFTSTTRTETPARGSLSEDSPAPNSGFDESVEITNIPPDRISYNALH
ncbi:hypothetical protein PoB_001198600 [Plakobranchus ocellatus]|uniref:Uncharacterized protein n=1 Tax=Plakobranchus ocellatus TaxID=259542 RepID=A0AAV3YSV2_9GAST|nr:hypothetical protein PoB_001198600 [Plakobranchus ocellatus]